MTQASYIKKITAHHCNLTEPAQSNLYLLDLFQYCLLICTFLSDLSIPIVHIRLTSTACPIPIAHIRLTSTVCPIPIVHMSHFYRMSDPNCSHTSHFYCMSNPNCVHTSHFYCMSNPNCADTSHFYCMSDPICSPAFDDSQNIRLKYKMRAMQPFSICKQRYGRAATLRSTQCTCSPLRHSGTQNHCR
jgi:hypothetical protein